MITLRQVLVQTLACSAALVLLPLSPPSRASAQEVEWRYDYSKARQEAVEKGRPLVIDFVTDSCVFCQRMDMGTFRDPGIVAQLNRYCIPLKIDGNRQAGPGPEAAHRQLSDAGLRQLRWPGARRHGG